MKEQRRWGPPGWPWELELLALLFVITAMVVPYYFECVHAPPASPLSLLDQAEQARGPKTASWQDLRGIFWAVLLIGLYLTHLAMARATIPFMSTPLAHLLSPPVFSAITYVRLCEVGRGSPIESRIVSGSPVEFGLWMLGVLIITFLLARIRMARLMLGFRDVDWDLSTPPLIDSSLVPLLWQLRPLIYLPRVYRACERGIVIEGWFYVMPIPFECIHAIDAVQGTAFVPSSYCLATSSEAMIRIQITEQSEPILISPADRTAYLRYGQQRLATAPALLRNARIDSSPDGARKTP